MSLPTALTGSINDSILVVSQSVDAYGAASSQSTTWASSNNGIATVQSTVDIPNGALIICLAVGTAVITATAGSATATFNLTVVNPSAGVATSIEVNTSQMLQPVKKMQ